MKQYINEAKRWQQLAGIIKEAEGQSNETGGISQEIQALVDKNEFLKGKVKATPSDLIEGSKFVLLFSEDAAKHIAERHLDKTKPGSLFKSGVNLRDIAKKLLNISPSEEAGGRVKWLGANGGNVGEMGVAKSTPEKVAKMKDYTMPDGQKEQVKITPGKRKPTSEVSLITAELGILEDGRKALSLITMFPGGTKVDGTEIPMNRGEFASKGLYFVVDPSSPLLKEEMNEDIDTSNWGNEKDEYGNSEKDFKFKPDLADFDYNEEDYKDYMEKNFPGESLDLEEELKEVLDDLKDAQSASSWLKTQLDTYVDNNLSDGYGSGYQVEEQLKKLLKLITKKFNIPESSFKVEDKYDISYNEYDEGTTKGEIKLNGQPILTYSSHSDGYGFNADIDENALKAELEKLIKPTSESFDNLDEIVDRVLTKMRRRLNENLTQDSFEQLIDDLIDKVIEDNFYGSGPSDEDEEDQLRNAVVARAQEELETQYPGIEIKVSNTNKGNEYVVVGDEEKGIPYIEYLRS
jgi:hypothetical protein